MSDEETIASGFDAAWLKTPSLSPAFNPEQMDVIRYFAKLIYREGWCDAKRQSLFEFDAALGKALNSVQRDFTPTSEQPALSD